MNGDKRVPVRMNQLLAREYDRILTAVRPTRAGVMLSGKEYLALLTRRTYLHLLRGEITTGDIRRAGAGNAGKISKEFRLTEGAIEDIRRTGIAISTFLRGVVCSEHEYRSRLLLEAEWREKYGDDPSSFSTGLLYMQLKNPDPVDKDQLRLQRTLLGLERRLRDIEDKVEGMKSLSDRYLIRGLENSSVPPNRIEIFHMTKPQLQMVCGRFDINLDTRDVNLEFLRHSVALHFGY